MTHVPPHRPPVEMLNSHRGGKQRYKARGSPGALNGSGWQVVLAGQQMSGQIADCEGHCEGHEISRPPHIPLTVAFHLHLSGGDSGRHCQNH